MHVHIHTYIHTYVHTYMHLHTYILYTLHDYTHNIINTMCMYSLIQKLSQHTLHTCYLHTHIHAYIHTYVHTYTLHDCHTYTCIYFVYVQPNPKALTTNESGWQLTETLRAETFAGSSPKPFSSFNFSISRVSSAILVLACARSFLNLVSAFVFSSYGYPHACMHTYIRT